ncbi:MAG: rRNA pseudouridine synthase [Bacteroidetes bacterium HGW-Bacteroidetes-6]|jgi:23S rRNA pseudouridine2605 synthase|nr:MAG: rRNA pseudouridine synthase [Bacteroidetes bacterium HGW-Bacteroidetes-6]
MQKRTENRRQVEKSSKGRPKTSSTRSAERKKTAAKSYSLSEKSEKPANSKKSGKASDTVKTKRGSKYSDSDRSAKDSKSNKQVRESRFEKSEGSTAPKRRVITSSSSKAPDPKLGKRMRKSNAELEVRLNKYIANSGICSRRDADVMIATGVVKVNGKVVSTLGYKVQPGDKVSVDGREIRSEKKVYLLLNKPKDTITTTDDPAGRRTVMELIKGACPERIYPVGRLDRNTTGLLLFTNDGDLSKKLIHPSHKIKKVYEVTLDNKLTKDHLLSISQGVKIDDDFVPVDGIAWSDPVKKNIVGIELHSGKYHIVKRIFEQFGYKVNRLDRTMFGPLTKKNLPRGTWRFLTDTEVAMLFRI